MTSQELISNPEPAPNDREHNDNPPPPNQQADQEAKADEFEQLGLLTQYISQPAD